MRALSFLLIVACFATSCGAKINGIKSLDEFEIYSLVLESRQQVSTFIVIDQGIDGAFGEQEEKSLTKLIPALQQDTFENFIGQKKQQMSPVNLRSDEKLVIISPAEVTALYPDVPRYPIFSRVGFSQDGRQALVYYIDRCPALCGYGAYFLFVKTSEGWRIQEISQTFAS